MKNSRELWSNIGRYMHKNKIRYLEDFYKKTSLSRQMIYHWEKGGIPKTPAIREMSQLFGIDESVVSRWFL